MINFSKQYLNKSSSKFEFFLQYRKVAFQGHISKMVRNDFDHQKKVPRFIFIKRNLGYLLIHYRSI